MAIQRALSVEDKDLNVASLVTTRDKLYSDIDLSFTLKKNKDVYKKTDAAAVKQAIKNLLMTNKLEKPFDVDYGGDLNRLLFELADEDTASEIYENVQTAIESYEPRAKIVDLIVTAENNDLNLYLQFRLENTGEMVTFNTSLSRIR